MENLSIKDIIDAFSGAKSAAREALPGRDQLLRALGGRPADDMMLSSFGIFTAGVVLGAGLAVLFAPRPGAEVREAISEKLSNLRSAAEG